MNRLLSIGASAWNLHAHRYYRVRFPVKQRTLRLGRLRIVITSYRVLRRDHFE